MPSDRRCGPTIWPRQDRRRYCTLGFNLFEKAREFGDARVRDDGPKLLPSEPQRLAGQGKPAHLPAPPADFDLEDAIGRAHHYSSNWRDMAALDRLYDESLAFHGPTDRELRGLASYKAFVLSMIAMFPDITTQIDEVYWMGNAHGARHPIEHDRADLHRNPLTKPYFEDAAFKASVLSKIKLGRLGQVEDVMGAVVFLASDASAMMTGPSLVIDGG